MWNTASVRPAFRAMTSKWEVCTCEYQVSIVLFIHNDDPVPELPTYPDECACGASHSPVINRIVREWPDETETA